MAKVKLTGSIRYLGKCYPATKKTVEVPDKVAKLAEKAGLIDLEKSEGDAPENKDQGNAPENKGE